MTFDAPFGGGIYIADTSAWNRLPQLDATVRSEWSRALADGQIATAPLVVAELLYSTRNPENFKTWRDELGALRRVGYVGRAVQGTVFDAFEELAGQGAHRSVKFPDLFTAAAASVNHWGVLHYDDDFDRLAGLQALDFESRWIAPRGTLS